MCAKSDIPHCVACGSEDIKAFVCGGVEKFLYKATGGSVSLGDLSVENAMIHGLPKTLDDLLNNPGENLTYQDYASDIREILAYKRTQHKDIMSELNVQFIMLESTIQIKDRVSK